MMELQGSHVCLYGSIIYILWAMHNFFFFCVQPYIPNTEVSFLALSKLEALAKLPVLTAIEDNAERFVDTAGFKLLHYVRKVRIAHEYIESWKEEKIPFTSQHGQDFLQF